MSTEILLCDTNAHTHTPNNIWATWFMQEMNVMSNSIDTSINEYMYVCMYGLGCALCVMLHISIYIYSLVCVVVFLCATDSISFAPYDWLNGMCLSVFCANEHPQKWCVHKLNNGNHTNRCFYALLSIYCWLSLSPSHSISLTLFFSLSLYIYNSACHFAILDEK